MKEKGLAPVFLDLRLEHPAGWICVRYKSSVLLLLLCSPDRIAPGFGVNEWWVFARLSGFIVFERSMWLFFRITYLFGHSRTAIFWAYFRTKYGKSVLVGSSDACFAVYRSIVHVHVHLMSLSPVAVVNIQELNLYLHVVCAACLQLIVSF